LKDFSIWNTSDIHDFHLSHENDIEGNEFSYIDQLAVESEHSSNTVSHTILANDTIPQEGTEHLKYNLTLSTNSSFSEEVTQVLITTTTHSSTTQYQDEENEEEATSTPKLFTAGVSPNREPEVANIQESQDQVTDTDDQVAIPFRDNPPLKHYHDIIAPIEHETETPYTETSTENNQHTPGLLSVEEVHIHGSVNFENHEIDEFNDHFDLVTANHGENHAYLDMESFSPVSNKKQATPLYNSDLYEVVTSQINPESDLVLNDQEDFSAYEYEIVTSNYGDEFINSNYTDYETGDINVKYATFLDNLHSKYEVLADTTEGNREHVPKLFEDSLPKVLLDASDVNREHVPKLFEDSLSILVENKANIPKLFDKGLPPYHQDDTLENALPSVETSLENSHTHDMEHPLVSLMEIEPHAMKLLVKTKKIEPDTMVRLMYERVPRNKPALQQHLDDPVIEYVHVYRLEQEHYLTDLPMGKYIVCGEAQHNGEVFQSNCFETSIDRLDNNMLQGGVIAVIAVALLIVFCVIMYAIYHKVVLSKRKDSERE